MMFKAFPLAHSSSVLLLKQQMIISVKKNIKNTSMSNQCKIHWFLPKFAQKIPMKLAGFWQLFFGKVSPENFRESVSEKPAKFDFFHNLSEAP